jgi:two-component system, cell cycle response regulator CtrA
MIEFRPCKKFSRGATVMLILRIGRDHAGEVSGGANLRSKGISCEHVELGREGLKSVGLFDYSLVLVNLELPDMPGHEAIRLMRVAGVSTPCIVLATQATAQIKIKALDYGADDFVIIPCHPDEMIARIHAVIRRSQPRETATSVLRVGPMEMNQERHEVRIHGQLVAMSRREFSVLELMCLKPGVPVDQDAFVKHIYNGMEDVALKTIDVFICRLRKKFALAGAPNLIATLWGTGYVLRVPKATCDPAIEASKKARTFFARGVGAPSYLRLVNLPGGEPSGAPSHAP